MFRGYINVWFILTDRCSSTSRHIPVSRYAREFILPVSIPIIICLTVYDVRNSLILIEKQVLCDRITYWWGTWFSMHEGTGASPWTGQYFRTAERRTWHPDKCDILSLICMDMWLFITYWGRMQYAICTRMYSIMEDLDLRPRYFSVKDTTMIPRW